MRPDDHLEHGILLALDPLDPEPEILQGDGIGRLRIHQIRHEQLFLLCLFIILMDEIEGIVFRDLDSGRVTSIHEAEKEADLFQCKKVRIDKQGWGEFWGEVEDCKHKLWQFAESGKLEEMVELLNSGLPVEINCKGLDDWSAVHYAAFGNQPEIMLYLMNNKADMQAITKSKRNAAHIAAIRGHTEIILVLIPHKQIFLGQDSDQNTPLHLACESSNSELTRLLLQHMPKKMTKNRYNLTPYDLCSAQLRALFQEENLEPEEDSEEYSRTRYDGVVLSNGRMDHVRRFLMNDRKKAKTLQVEVGTGVKDNHRERRLIAIERITIESQKVNPNSFDYYRMLGKGSFGEVYLATLKADPNKKLLAIKILEKDKIFGKNLVRYASTQKKVLTIIKHPFIVEMSHAFQNEDKLFIALEYCPGGDLGQLLSRKKKVSEAVARVYVAELILAFQELHHNEILFRDLKPENVVIDEKGHMKLTDFGLSKEMPKSELSYSFCGSLAYLAPQILNRTGHSKAVDWYLLGLLLYELLIGMPPYYNSNKDLLFENIKKGALKMPKSLSHEAKDLIKQLLHRDQTQRLGAKEDAEEIKRHPFFEGICWRDVLEKKYEVPAPEIAREMLGIPMQIDFKGTRGERVIENWTFIR